MALIRTADLGRLSAPAAMAIPGRIIGVEKGTTGQRYIEEVYPVASLRHFPSPDDGVAALRRGEIEFFVHDAPTIWTLTVGADLPAGADVIALYTPLTRERLAWAVQKENVALLDDLNAALLTMQQDGSARRILNKWITGSVTVSSPLAPVEF
jgi:ABC-type amino acid transport substrate-binding protein